MQKQASEGAGRNGDLSPEPMRVGMVLLVAFALLTCLAGLEGGPPMGDHECINAQSARETIQSGDWLVPTLNGAPWVRKTPLGIWFIAGASYLVDDPSAAQRVTQYSARLPSALAGLATALVVCRLGSMLYGRRSGLVAGFVTAGSLGMIVYARNAQVDMLLTLMTTVAYGCFWGGAMAEQPNRGLMARFYVAFALAMMAKAPLPLMTVGVPLAVFWFVTRPVVRWSHSWQSRSAPPLLTEPWHTEPWHRGLKVLWIVPGVILFLVLAGLWPVYVSRHVDGVLGLWREEYLNRFTGDMTERSKPAWYYIPLVFGLMAPYFLSIPEAVGAVFLPRYREHRPGLAYAFTWAVVGTILVSASAFKRPHYLISIVPAYCLLLAPVIDRLFFGAVGAPARYLRAVCVVLSVVIASAVIVGGVYVRRLFPGFLVTYALAGGIAGLVWMSACWAYAKGWRTASFAQLNVGVLVLVLLVWPGLRHVPVNVVGDALAASLRDHGILPPAKMVWVDVRPDSSLEFYWGYSNQRLMDERELAKLRPSRRTVSPELLQAGADRIGQRLRRTPDAHLILSAFYYDLLREQTEIPAREECRVTGLTPDPKTDLVVITAAEGSRPPASSPATQPESQPASLPTTIEAE